MTGELGRLLEWDTEFWGMRIAQATATALDDGTADDLDQWCQAAGVDCAYLLGAADDGETANIARRRGYVHADTRVTLESLLKAQTRVDCPVVRLAVPEDVQRLQAIAAVSHEQSRFYFDRRFPRDRCSRLYQEWIARSCAGWAQAVLVTEDNGQASGYVTCHIDDQSHARIGLLAVDSNARGKGAGRMLVSAAREWAEDLGIATLSVVTQARNAAGLRLYESCDFKVASVGEWYHCWYDRTENV